MVLVVMLAGQALHAETPTQIAYKAGKARISAERKSDNDSVATEKCDALSGDSKNDCIAVAKVHFGKN
jgi:uncharacterized membrane protein